MSKSLRGHSVIAPALAVASSGARAAMRRAITAFVLCGLAVASPVDAQRAIPLRAVSVLAATDSGVVATVTSVSPLSNGRILVSDFLRRRVIVLDSALRLSLVVLANEDGTHEKYGGRVAYVLPYLADTSAFIDQESRSFVLIDPNGRVRRVMAPLPATNLSLVSSFSGHAIFDHLGRLYYQQVRRPMQKPDGTGNPDSGKLVMLPPTDSAVILRADMANRKTDTVAVLHVATHRTGLLGTGAGKVSVVTEETPIDDSDGWTVLADGTVAVLRAHDYHIDWRRPNGDNSSTSPMPFDWKRISHDEKVSMIEALRKTDSDQRAREAAAQRSTSPTGGRSDRPPFMAVAPDDLPDYFPPLLHGEVRADADDNVWILPSTSKLAGGDGSGLVYDVVNGKGQISERVRLPAQRSLIGFGIGGVVYLVHQVAERGHRVTIIEKAKVER